LSPHARFRLDGNDLHLDIDIVPWQAALGDEVVVETLIDKVQVKIPESTSSGDRVRVPGRGYPARSGTGDLYISFTIVGPPVLLERERHLYEKLQRATGEGVSAPREIRHEC
tara:strand:+ start:274 stop:609 length:336 start_codon:yes stop_codon:yes gene_type:complete